MKLKLIHIVFVMKINLIKLTNKWHKTYVPAATCVCAWSLVRRTAAARAACTARRATSAPPARLWANTPPAASLYYVSFYFLSKQILPALCTLIDLLYRGPGPCVELDGRRDQLTRRLPSVSRDNFENGEISCSHCPRTLGIIVRSAILGT